MSEAISYISSAELPVVFVNIVRGGPGLGGILPSQADYFQATKGGGHGDYHLLVMAPASVQEAVEMVMAAFPLAEKYRNPVMILGDGLIGQMMEPVEFSDRLISKPTNKDDWATNGMDTRKRNDRNLVKSLFLDAGQLEEHNLALKAKYDRMKQEEVRYETYNIDSDFRALIVSYGTMSRVCKTAIDNMKAEGFETAMIRPQTLFPFPVQPIRQAASKDGCEAVISFELSMGQMVEDVERSVQGKCPVYWHGKAGCEIPTPEEVVDAVKSFVKTK
jgi:2-oxoglutarate ferredoxin oxidoreductase subunit alpha